MGKIADDIIEGYCCQWCNTYFEEPKGYPALCKECESELSKKEQERYTLSQQRKKQKSGLWKFHLRSF